MSGWLGNVRALSTYRHPQCSLSLSLSCFFLLNFLLLTLADKYPPLFSHSLSNNTWVLLSNSLELLLSQISANMVLFVFLDFNNNRYQHKHQIAYTTINRHRSFSKIGNKLRINDHSLNILSVQSAMKIIIFSEQRVISQFQGH